MKNKCLYQFVIGCCVIFSLVLNAGAASYVGGDWQGQDLIAADGDSFTGTFTNINRFSVSAGFTIFVSGTIEFHTINTDIYGIVDMQTQGDVSLTISAIETINFSDPAEILNYGGGTITLEADILNISRCIFSDCVGGDIIVGGGDLITVPPIDDSTLR